MFKPPILFHITQAIVGKHGVRGNGSCYIWKW